MRKMMLTVITVQAQVAQRADNSTTTDNRCPAIRKTDVLSFGNFDKTPIKTLEFDAREFSSIVDCFYCSLRWRNKRSYILSAVVYIYIVKH